MQKRDGKVLFSAGDLVGYIECEHLTTLGLAHLETPLQKAKADEQMALIQDMGFAHEAAYLERLRAKGVRVVEIPDEGDPQASSAATLKAMREGAECLYQAAFLSGNLFGKADFLHRVPLASALGDWSYEVADTKLGRSPRAKFLVQLAFYSEMVAEVQGVEPRSMHLALGDGTEKSFRVANYSRYFRQVRSRFLAYAGALTHESYPERCDHCSLCDWREHCEARWKADDHLNQVAGMSKVQIERLQAADIRTLERLATLGTASVPKVQAETLAKLRSQAALQLAKRTSGKSHVENLPLDAEGRRGFYRLPEPDAGDVFFDLEGDPFEPDGLDYLFGVRYREGGRGTLNAARFDAYWAHSREDERRAFERFMDFIAARVKAHPGMHIYHYSHYEPTALKRMMSLHGTREAAVDDLLRQGRLVDLYKVVRESVRTSEDGLSLKDIEALYGFKRENEVATAGASVVYYHYWRETQDASLLEKIRSYNEDDCRSTEECRDWLLHRRPPGFSPLPLAGEGQGEGSSSSAKVQAFESRLADYENRLLGDLPDRECWTPDHHLRELSFQLLGFHRREAKPAWWALFNRQDLTEDELVEDIECLGALVWDGKPPTPVKKSAVYRFTFPEQDTKLRAGKDCTRADTTDAFGEITLLDEEKGCVEIKVSGNREVPKRLSIGPGGPINYDVLCAATFRFADSLLAGDGRFAAIRSLLNHSLPRLRGSARVGGNSLLSGKLPLLEETLDVVSSLDDSYLYIQGPPGSGKTYTGSHLIVGLLQAGKRVGVSSNSHKAIHNLLTAVEKVAEEKGVKFRGAKKCSKGDPETHFDGRQIENVFDNDGIDAAHQLVAGTAWLFARDELEESLDYLFIDEAGQVSLANLVAMGTAARNIVLLGDQMQLGQPIQGVHPGRSGDSTLEYLLDGAATIANERGIFLPTSRRMHEGVCRFISDAVYDGRLNPEPENQERVLVLSKGCHPALRPAGISFVGLEHDGCSQKSLEEALTVVSIYESLLAQRRSGQGPLGPDPTPSPMTIANIMVVAPYNAQVNLLRAKLPKGARVGTIDKFQGQEAEAVIVSMTTSSGDYLPRNIEFLYDKNRLNVAVSRAKCLAVVVASPKLLHVRCTTPEEMELVNTLCWVREFAG